MKDKKGFSVWVDGEEFWYCYLNKRYAEAVAKYWRSRGHEDVVIKERA